MRWLVGVDLRSSDGALRLAAWLARTAREPQAFVGVHVIEEDDLRAVLRFRHLEEVIAEARDAVGQVLERAGASGLLESVEVVGGGRAEDRLEELRGARACDAILIGRLAKRGAHPLVRLGRVARRLLRRHPAPVLIAPPDFDAAQLGSGPVVALTRLTLDSAAALRFARLLADGLGRPLAALHVIPDPMRAAAYGLGRDQLDDLRRQATDSAERELGAWLDEAGIQVDERAVAVGEVVDQANAAADRAGAPVLVAGSRRAPGVEALVAVSLGRELAATARLPIALVPPV
ncbi:MAG TPA: universal stress protein, partial [Anaeromyxobacteraceae bacterium]|nr:universal stress protein [Anaeromyxobacteraceae bacterium]